MSYTKITNFAIKDSTNDIIKGTEFDDEFNSIEASFTAQPSATQTLTNKTIALGSNTVSGTTAQFNTALSDGNFATLAGSEALSNKTTIGVSGYVGTAATGALTMPSGTTAERPATPATGMIRYNSTLGVTEYYDGAAWYAVTSGLAKTPNVEYLVVAGGAGGGGNDITVGRASGGGGAGGYRTATGFAVTAGSAITVTVGAGGAGAAGGATNDPGANGGNSVFGSITSTGGGGGSGSRGGTGNNGGSGGGGGDNGTANGGLGNTPSTSPSQGNNGGASGAVGVAGSGGGASGAGTTSTGGTGSASSISGSSVTYSTGGNAGQTSPAIGATNTGSGGGGNAGASASGFAGGSGIVIIRYADAYPLATSTTGSPTVTTAGGYRVYKWTGSGSITF